MLTHTQKSMAMARYQMRNVCTVCDNVVYISHTPVRASKCSSKLVRSSERGSLTSWWIKDALRECFPWDEIGHPWLLIGERRALCAEAVCGSSLDTSLLLCLSPSGLGSLFTTTSSCSALFSLPPFPISSWAAPLLASAGTFSGATAPDEITPADTTDTPGSDDPSSKMEQKEMEGVCVCQIAKKRYKYI